MMSEFGNLEIYPYVVRSLFEAHLSACNPALRGAETYGLPWKRKLRDILFRDAEMWMMGLRAGVGAFLDDYTGSKKSEI